jgi:L-ascorbate metabolism protein UlaG (beta-lactamase superfamily)
LRSAAAASLVAAAATVAASPAAAQVRVEYVAHACFVVESPSGVRALVDPYNGTRWLGYSFPEGIRADVVLVSHPHYDHDASYYAPASAPVLRTPGVRSFADLRVTGIEGRHAEPYGEEFGRINTLWLIETGGLRIAHLGDTGPLSEASRKALGRIDVLLLPVDDQDHILDRAEIAAIRSELQAAVTVPMHYRLAQLTQLPDSLGPIDAWLGEQRNVVRLGSHATVLSERPRSPQVLVFAPSPGVKPWPASLFEAFEHRSKARALAEKPEGREAAIAERQRAAQLAPVSMLFAHELANAQSEAGRKTEAVAGLESALAAAGRDDWEYPARARDLLARLYAERGDRERAAQQYRLVLRDEARHELRARAQAFLEGKN